MNKKKNSENSIIFRMSQKVFNFIVFDPVLAWGLFCGLALIFIFIILIATVESPEQKTERRLNQYTQNYDLCMSQDHSEEFCINFAQESKR